MMGFVRKTIGFVREMMGFVSKTMGFVRKKARYFQFTSTKNQKVSLPLHLYNNIRNQFDNYKLKRSSYAKFL